jgi:hypothetical protein
VARQGPEPSLRASAFRNLAIGLATKAGAVAAAACVAFAVRYDSSMTAAKIAITLPQAQVAHIKRIVRAGQADSVSGYISNALAAQERQESLQALITDLVAQHGEPTPKETAWARRALGQRRRG